MNAVRYAAARAGTVAARGAAVAASRGLRTAYRVGPYVKTTGLKRKRFARNVRKIMNMNKELNFLDYAFGKSELYHNTYTTGTCLFPLNDAATSGKLPTQGDGDSQRTGNQILPRSFRLRVMVLLKGDRINAKVRFMVLSFPKGVVPSTIGSFMDAVTGNLHIDPIDTGRVRKHVDRTIGYRNVNPGPGAAAKEVTIFRNFNVPLRGTWTFYDDGSQDNSCLRDYYVITVAYDTYGSLVTDNIAAVQIWRRFSFRDK